MPLSLSGGRTFTAPKTLGFANATKKLMKFLAANSIAYPNYSTLVSWDNLLRTGNVAAFGASGWYSVDGAPSDSTYLLDGPNRVILVADKSGNSAVNGLVLNGVAGNYASAPDSASLSVTGDIDLRVQVALADWTPATANTLIGKIISATNNRSYLLGVNTNGTFKLVWSTDGAAGTAVTVNSTVAPTVSDFSTLWVRVTLDVDNGSGGYTVIFYTSSDGSTWTQLGASVVGGSTTSIFNGTAPLEVGAFNVGANEILAGIIYRAQIYNGINGTLVFDADFTAAAKLVTSFTESSSNAATVTINSTGDTGARISGARDLVQFSTTKMPTIATIFGVNRMLFDGVNDYMSAPTAFFRAAGGGAMYAAASRTANVGSEAAIALVATSVPNGRLFMVFKSPLVANEGVAAGGRRLNVDAGEGIGSEPYTSSRIIASCVATWSAAQLSIRQNRNAAVIDTSFQTAGVTDNDAGNLFIGSAAGGSAAFLNGTVNELIIRSDADNTGTQMLLATYLANKWRVYI